MLEAKTVRHYSKLCKRFDIVYARLQNNIINIPQTNRRFKGERAKIASNHIWFHKATQNLQKPHHIRNLRFRFVLAQRLGKHACKNVLLERIVRNIPKRYFCRLRYTLSKIETSAHILNIWVWKKCCLLAKIRCKTPWQPPCFNHIISNVKRSWRNRQTRTFEGRMVTPSEFKSRWPHQTRPSWTRNGSIGLFFSFFSGSSLVNKPNETWTRPRKMPIIKHFGRSDKIETP